MSVPPVAPVNVSTTYILFSYSSFNSFAASEAELKLPSLIPLLILKCTTSSLSFNIDSNLSIKSLNIGEAVVNTLPFFVFSSIDFESISITSLYVLSLFSIIVAGIILSIFNGSIPLSHVTITFSIKASSSRIFNATLCIIITNLVNLFVYFSFYLHTSRKILHIK